MKSLSVEHLSSRAAIIPVVVTILCLAPFVCKAFHIDDPVFLWSAKQIHEEPLDFYGFEVNWYGTKQSMAEIHHNPPLTCYYIAVAASVFGWSEVALHIAFLIPAVAVAMGTYYLARRFCSRPTLAALAVVLTPVFLVSSSNIMCDTMTLAFWVWAVVLWVRGMKENSYISLFFSVVLIGFCSLTRYVGISLLGLLFVYSLMQRRRLGVWVLFLLIPVVMLAGYLWATYVLYDSKPLFNAASFATEKKWAGSAALFTKVLVGLTFTGGCILTSLFYIPLLWSRRVIGIGVVLTILFISAFSFWEKIDLFSIHTIDGVKWGFLVQLVLMAAGGFSLLAVAVVDFWKNRDADSLLLLLWIFGIFVFAGFINWTNNARSILPMIPAAGILLIRRIEQRGKYGETSRMHRLLWPLIPAMVVALLVCWSDYKMAQTAREAASAVQKEFGDRNGKIWFQGNWGFRYYMEANGYEAFDYTDLKMKSSDMIVVPRKQYRFRRSLSRKIKRSWILEFTPCRWLATMELPLGAGFYSDVYGPLPFVIGRAGKDNYDVFTVK